MQAVRRRSVRRIRKRKTVQQFFWVYGNYIAAGMLAAVVLAVVTTAAVKLSAADKPQKAEAENQTGQMATVQQEPA